MSKSTEEQNGTNIEPKMLRKIVVNWQGIRDRIVNSVVTNDIFSENEKIELK